MVGGTGQSNGASMFKQTTKLLKYSFNSEELQKLCQQHMFVLPNIGRYNYWPGHVANAGRTREINPAPDGCDGWTTCHGAT